MSPPLITVIVAVFNNVDTLEQCVNSVFNQTYPNKELIIIDGNSEDGSVQLLHKNTEKISYWISESDSGVYSAWNKGVIRANGEWICFLGADDYFWNNQVLEKLSLKLMRLSFDVNLAYGKIMLLDINDKALFTIGKPWESIQNKFYQGECLPHPAVMHRKDLFEKNGLFDESFHIAGDYELMLRELKKATPVFIPDVIVTAMRQGGLSSQPSNSMKIMFEARRALKKHGQDWPGILLILRIIKIFLRIVLWKILGREITKKILDLGRRLKGEPAYWTKI